MSLFEIPWDDIKDDAGALQQLATEYVSYYKKNPCCPETLKGFHRQMRRNFKRSMIAKKDKPETTYKLKPGKMIFIHSMSLHVSEVNLTDDLAVLALKENPRQESFFDFIPGQVTPVI